MENILTQILADVTQIVADIPTIICENLRLICVYLRLINIPFLLRKLIIAGAKKENNVWVIKGRFKAKLA